MRSGNKSRILALRFYFNFKILLDLHMELNSNKVWLKLKTSNNILQVQKLDQKKTVGEKEGTDDSKN